MFRACMICATIVGSFSWYDRGMLPGCGVVSTCYEESRKGATNQRQQKVRRLNLTEPITSKARISFGGGGSHSSYVRSSQKRDRGDSEIQSFRLSRS